MRFRSLLIFAVVCLCAAIGHAQTKSASVQVNGQTTVTFSATPTFDANKANAFKLTLTGNVTSSTLINADAGQELIFDICQDGTGGRTFVPPTNVLNWSTISSTASTCSVQFYTFDGTNALPDMMPGLTGDVTSSPGSTTTTVGKVNGVTYPSGPSTHSVLVITGTNTGTYKVIPDCQDTTGNHLNYTQSTDAWSCGTTGKTQTPNKQIFTASGTFTIPTGVTAVKVTVCGGGGAGGGASATQDGGGGGSGSTGIKWLTGLTPGNTLSVTIGGGGTGASAAAGGNGTGSTIASGTQTITSIVTNGGTGGPIATSGNGATGGDGGAAGTGGDMNLQGTAGSNGSALSGGSGGGSIFGGAARGATGAVGNNAGGFCSGGGGAGQNVNNAGGNGSGGVALFEWVS